MTHSFAIRAATMLLCVSAASSHATGYYVSCNGNDAANNSTNTPWATMAKANSVAISGDAVYLARGCTYNETLNVKSGVTYTSYGSGLKPIISGSRNVGGLTWQVHSGSIYVADASAIVGTSTINQLYLNGTRLTKARVPNIGKGSYAVTDSLGRPASRYLKIGAKSDPKNLPLYAADAQAIRAQMSQTGGDLVGAVAYIRTVQSELMKYAVNGWSSTTTDALAIDEQTVVEGGNYHYGYALTQDSGYWLENKLWMLDTAGEWYFDPATKKLYVWLPNGSTPKLKPLFASVQESGIVAANGASNFRLQDIEVRETNGDGIAFKSSSNNATIVTVDVLRAGRRGIAMTGTSGNKILYSTVSDSVKDGIWLGDVRDTNNTPPSNNTTIQNTTIKNAGLDYYAHAAIQLGYNDKVQNNTVLNTSYIGILGGRGANISNNLVKNVCMQFDDGGGIYIGGAEITTPLYAQVTNNMVDGGYGSADGLPSGAGDDSRGIYLDDYVNTSTVSGNFVTGTRYGYMLHTTKNITLSNNLAFNNRSFNLLIQEGKAGLMSGNSISQNAFVASKNASAPSTVIPNIWQIAEGGQGNTRNLATYTGNRYASLNSQLVAYNYGVDVPVGMTDMTFPMWQGIQNDLQGSFKLVSTDTEPAAYAFYTPTGGATRTINCPASTADRCNAFVNLATGAPVIFPVTLPANSAIIMVR